MPANTGANADTSTRIDGLLVDQGNCCIFYYLFGHLLYGLYGRTLIHTWEGKALFTLVLEVYLHGNGYAGMTERIKAPGLLGGEAIVGYSGALME